MMGHDDGPGISFHDFNGACASSIVLTEDLLFIAAVLKTDIESVMSCVRRRAS